MIHRAVSGESRMKEFKHYDEVHNILAFIDREHAKIDSFLARQCSIPLLYKEPVSEIVPEYSKEAAKTIHTWLYDSKDSFKLEPEFAELESMIQSLPDPNPKRQEKCCVC